MHVYPEKTLQLAAVAWMTEHWGYQELAGDAEATGDRMDSIGLLRGAPVAMEVKTSVSNRMVRFGTVANALEAKIAATVGGLYRNERKYQLDLLRQFWDQRCAPEIAILAAAYIGDALDELCMMLQERGSDWSFSSSVWLWTGTSVEQLFRHEQPASENGVWSAIEVPVMIGKSLPRVAPSLEEFRALAAGLAMLSVLDTCIRLARVAGLRRSLRPTGIAFSETRDGRNATVLALFLDRTDQDQGINVGIDAERFNWTEGSLPGNPAPRAGFLNTNRYMSEPADFERLFASYAREWPPATRQ